jgi:hypothetical protein
LTAAQPTTEEKAVVDVALGAPESGWVGGPRQIEKDGRTARLSVDMRRAPRHHLLPMLRHHSGAWLDQSWGTQLYVITVDVAG